MDMIVKLIIHQQQVAGFIGRQCYSYFQSHDELEKESLSKEKSECALDRKSQRMFEGFSDE
jgi:hypothetical protein